MELKIHVSLDKHKYIDVEIPVCDSWLYNDQQQVIIETMYKVIDMMRIATSQEQNDEQE